MSYGLQLKDGSGNVTLSVTTRLTRRLYTATLAAASSGSVTVPGFDATKGVAIAEVMSPPDFQGQPHYVTASGSTVSWTACPVTAWQRQSQLNVFMYA